MIWLRQILSFGAVGISATLVHVAAAWLLFDGAGFGGLAANTFGAAIAFVVSYVGNARFTFASERGLLNGAPRYLPVTLVSLALTSTVLAFVERNGLPTYVYALVVLLTVPPTTLLMAKLWVFRPPRH